MKKSFIATSIVLASSFSFADDIIYIGAGGQLGTFEQTNTSGFDDADFTAFQLILGVYIRGNHALELRYTDGISGEEFTHSGSEQTIEVSEATSIFYKYDFNLTESVNIYPLLGFTESEFDVEYTNSSSSNYTIVDSSGFSYGLGLSAKVKDNIKLYAEYISYFSDDKESVTIDYTGVSAGINILFD